MHPWWANDCPGRGPALSHTPSQDDQTLCLHCLQRVNTAPARPPMPPVDVAARYRALGLEMPHIPPPPHDEDELVEPSHITGKGPQGPAWGVGRGVPTLRFFARVEAFVGWRAFLASRSLGDTEPTLPADDEE